MKSGAVERLMTIFREKRKFLEVFLCQSLLQFKNKAVLGLELAKYSFCFLMVQLLFTSRDYSKGLKFSACLLCGFFMSQAKLLGVLNDVNKFWIFVTVI